MILLSDDTWKAATKKNVPVMNDFQILTHKRKQTVENCLVGKSISFVNPWLLLISAELYILV